MNTTLTPDHLDHYLESAQREIAFCENCQPTEAGQTVWRYGLPVKISELLFRLGVPEGDQEFLAESLECNNCGTLLHLSATIGVRSKSEREWEQLWRKWENQFAPRFRDFHDFLADYPSLGLQHRLGRQLFKALGDLPRMEVSLATLYCAKPVTHGRPFTSEDFDAAQTATREVCYQHAEQRTYVLAEAEAGAARDVAASGEKIVWLQKFQLTRCKGILDLSRLFAEGITPVAAPLMFGLNYRGAALRERTSGETSCLVARFLTDCARLHGYNGMRTKSVKHASNNLLLFAWPAEALALQGEPYLYDLREAAAIKR